MEQLKRVQVKLAQENTDRVRRAEVLVMEVEELRKEVSEIKMEGRVNQGKIETSVASVKDLTEKRISEMTAIMVQRDRQADEGLKHMSEMMHHRDLDVDKTHGGPHDYGSRFNPRGEDRSGDDTKPSHTRADGTKLCRHTIYECVS